MHSWVSISAVAAIAMSGLTACTHSNPIDDPVSARSSVDFMLWRARESERLSPAECGWFEKAIEDLRLKLMNDGSSHQCGSTEAALLPYIDGEPVRRVMIKGMSYRLRRLRDERDKLSASLDYDATLVTYRDDELSANYLKDLERAQLRRRERDVVEINDACMALSKLGVSPLIPDGGIPLVLVPHQTIERPERPITDPHSVETRPKGDRAMGLPPPPQLPSLRPIAPAIRSPGAPALSEGIELVRLSIGHELEEKIEGGSASAERNDAARKTLR